MAAFAGVVAIASHEAPAAQPAGNAGTPVMQVCSFAPAATNRSGHVQAVDPVPRAAPKPSLAKPPLAGPVLVLRPAAPPVPVRLGKRLLWYIPNRLIDLVDIFRLRLRVGPGLAANMRITDYGAFYMGEYHSIYAGLPGPRNPHYVRWPVGLEGMKGIVLGGVDATDDVPYGPEYGPTEVDVGLHLLLVGADVGIDPLEIADFLSGFLLVDIEGDDYPRPRGPEAQRSSGVSRGSARNMFQVNEKPPIFHSFAERLDYLQTNVQERVSRPVRTVDEYFAPDAQQLAPVPDSRLRLGIYAEFIGGQGTEFAFKPDVDLDVAVPNLENRLHVFVQSGQADDLPGRSLSETEERGLTLGARQALRKYSISADAGVRASWPPRAYARLTWHPQYEYEQWSFRPQQRFFYDTRDKLGALSTLNVDRWLGGRREYYAGSVSSAKYLPFKEQGSDTENIPPGEVVPYEGDLTWEQTFRLGRVHRMIEDRACGGLYDRRDVASGGDVSVSMFGIGSKVDAYRMTVGMRRPLYREWIFWEAEPGLEWTHENDFDPAFRLTLGIDMLFWGPAGR